MSPYNKKPVIKKKEMLTELKIAMFAYRKVELDAKQYEDAEKDYEKLMLKHKASIESVLDVKDNLECLLQGYNNLEVERERVFQVNDILEKYFPNVILSPILQKKIDYIQDTKNIYRDRTVISIAKKILVLETILQEATRPKIIKKSQ